ncbi:MAG: hypothetical protein ACR2MP_25830, partial [Streptosporangiaceae bacterium]
RDGTGSRGWNGLADGAAPRPAAWTAAAFQQVASRLGRRWPANSLDLGHLGSASLDPGSLGPGGPDPAHPGVVTSPARDDARLS